MVPPAAVVLTREGAAGGGGDIHRSPYTLRHTLYTIHHTPFHTIHHTLYTNGDQGFRRGGGRGTEGEAMLRMKRIGPILSSRTEQVDYSRFTCVHIHAR
jgi:hypothetical protein